MTSILDEVSDMVDALHEMASSLENVPGMRGGVVGNAGMYGAPSTGAVYERSAEEDAELDRQVKQDALDATRDQFQAKKDAQRAARESR